MNRYFSLYNRFLSGDFIQNIFVFLGIFCFGFTLRPFITCVYPFVDYLSNQYDFCAVKISFLTSIPVFCMGLFVILGRYLEKYLNKECIMSLATLLIACAFLLRSTYVNEKFFFLATLFGSIGIGVGGSLIGGFLKEHFSSLSMNAMGFYSFGIGLGAITGSEISLSAWSRNQLTLSVVTAVCGIVFFAVFYRRQPTAECLKKSHGFDLFCFNRKTQLLIFIFCLQSIINYTLLLWIQPYYMSLNITKSNYYRIIPFLLCTQLLSSFLVPNLLLKFKNKLLVLFWLAMLLSLSIVLLYFFPIAIFWFVLASIGFSTGAIFPMSLSLPIILSDNSEQAGRFFSTMLFGGYLLSAFGQLFLGKLIDLSGSYFSICLALLGASIILTSFIFILNQINKRNDNV